MTTKSTLLRLSVAAVWLLTAAASLVYPHEQNIALLERVGLHGGVADTALYAGIAMDILMGVLTLLNFRSWQKWLWPLQGAVIIVYSIIIAICLPDYALHPFGVLIKNLPILAILWLLWCEAKKGETHV
jgi:hypothetical protein